MSDKILFVAEKPSLGRAIAKALPGDLKDHGTHITVGRYIVAWAAGHLLEAAEPQMYNERYAKWHQDDLPIIPQKWLIIPKPDKKGMIKVIKEQLSKCGEVVNAGDPDREGQLLIDELLEYLGNTKPVRRLWVSALDAVSMKKALGEIKPNSEFQNLKNSAVARQRGDWLIGMNLTRQYTLRAQQCCGYTEVISVGRVIMAAVFVLVQRQLAIKDFKSKAFFNLTISLMTKQKSQDSFSANWRPQPGSYVTDEANRILVRKDVEKTSLLVSGKSGSVTNFVTADKEQDAPLPFSLSALQKKASAKHGFGAQKTLDLAQKLYEAKLISYPRSDCDYLPVSQLNEAPRIIRALSSFYADLEVKPDPGVRSKAWNDRKVTAHHAIIPTGEIFGTGHSNDELSLYELITKQYLAQFYPSYRYRQTDISVEIENELFSTSGRVKIDDGWKILVEESEDHDTNKQNKGSLQALPELEIGDLIDCFETKIIESKTTPPPYFDEGTFIHAMANIHNSVENPELKKLLKDTAGIGTEATRAGIIETMRLRKYAITKNRKFMATEIAIKLIDLVPPSLKSPGLTAMFEQMLDDIAVGKSSIEIFEKEIVAFTIRHTELAQKLDLILAKFYDCPKCKNSKLRLRKDKAGTFWGCVSYPNCNAAYKDKNGTPQF